MNLSRFISVYSATYLRSLVYILQASEYSIAEYAKWYARVTDFRQVEKRKKLVPTLKARLLLAAGWLLTLLGIWGVFSLSILYFPLVFLLLLIPYAVALLLPIPLWLISLAQKPLEASRIVEAQTKLATHPGLKIAIAGSFGKTSMREILRTVLSEDKTVAAPPHSHNTPLGISSFIMGLTGKEEILLFELGEYYPGDVKKLCQMIKPDLGIITGINEAHLDKFKTLSETTKTIFELSDYLGEKPLYVNAENTPAKNAAKESGLLYSREKLGSWQPKSIKTDLDGTSFSLKDHKFTSKLLGLHQIGPLLVAIDIAHNLGAPLEVIAAGVSKTKAFEHRLEPRTDASGVTILDDSYNGNPDGVKAVIDFLASLTGHRRFYMTPGLVEMGNRTQEVHLEIGAYLAKSGIEQIILLKNSVTGYIEKGLLAHGFAGTITWFDSTPQALQALPSLTAKGDIVLIQNDWPDQYS